MRKRLTPSDRQFIYNRYNGHCAYCGQVITRKNFHVDHTLPSCGSCACYKSTHDHNIALRFRIIEEHRGQIKFYFEQMGGSHG